MSGMQIVVDGKSWIPVIERSILGRGSCLSICLSGQAVSLLPGVNQSDPPLHWYPPMCCRLRYPDLLSGGTHKASQELLA